MKNFYFRILCVLVCALMSTGWMSAQSQTPATVPFFEGFEEGQVNNQNVAGWTHDMITKSKWIAWYNGSSFNTAPYQGNWNACLNYSSESWMFRPITFAAGAYKLSFYARQDYASTNFADISASIFSADNRYSELVAVVPTTGLTNGNYQLMEGTFVVGTAGTYYLGIHGWMNNSPYYISLDNISIDTDPAPGTSYTVTLASGASALGIQTIGAAYPGSKVSLAAPKVHGKMYSYTTNPTTISWVDKNTFIMPSENVTIGALLVNAPTYSISFHGTHTSPTIVGGVNSFYEGDTVAILVNPDTDYEPTGSATSVSNSLIGFSSMKDTCFVVMPGENLEVNINASRARNIPVTLEGVHCTLTANKTLINKGDTLKFEVTPDAGYVYPGVCWTTGMERAPEKALFVNNWGESYEVTVKCMPVRTVPFTEGFETNNTNTCALNSEYYVTDSYWGNGYSMWAYKDGSDALAPHTGSWCAGFRCNTKNWYCQPVYLEAGKKYTYAFYARQDGSVAQYATSSVILSSTYNLKDSIANFGDMTFVDGEYQRAVVRVEVPSTGVYWLGMNSYLDQSPNYFVFDDISMNETTPGSISLTSDAVALGVVAPGTAYFGDTVVLSASPTSGYRVNYTSVPAATWLDRNTFIMPEGDIALGASEEVIPYYTITCADVEGGAIVAPLNMPDGELVELSLIAPGKALKSFTVVGAVSGDPVVWTDATHFRMPAEAVNVSATIATAYPTPLYEGFETGYGHDYKFASYSGSKFITLSVQNSAGWRGYAGTYYNREAHSGTKVGYFPYQTYYKASEWAFMPVYLTAGETYHIEFYLKIGMDVNDGIYVRAAFGSTPTAEGMTTNIIARQKLNHQEYVKYEADYTPAQSGAIWLGFLGDYVDYPMNSYATQSIIIDDIAVYSKNAHAISFDAVATAAGVVASKTSAVVGDTVTLSWTNTEDIHYTFHDTLGITWIDNKSFVMPAQALEIKGVGHTAKPIYYKPISYVDTIIGKRSAFVGDTITLDYVLKAQYEDEVVFKCFYEIYATESLKWLDWNKFVMIDDSVCIGMDNTLTQYIRPLAVEEDFEKFVCCPGSNVNSSINGVRWNVSGPGADYSNDMAHSGTMSIRTYTTYLPTSVTISVRLNAGETYHLEYYSRLGNETYIQARMAPTIGRGAAVYAQHELAPMSPVTDDWAKTEVDFTVPDTAVYYIGISFPQDISYRKRVYIDDWKLYSTKTFALTLDSVLQSVGGTLSQTTAVYGDTITVGYTVPAGSRIDLCEDLHWVDAHRFVMNKAADVEVSALVRYKHAIKGDTTAYGYVYAVPDMAYVGDTVHVRYMRTDSSRDMNWWSVDEVSVVHPTDTTFVMGNTDLRLVYSTVPVVSIPFFDGFEGYQGDNAYIGDGWVNYWDWRANLTKTDYNRTPYAGKVNATLSYKHTCTLARPFLVEAGKQYHFSAYARQDYEDKKHANISLWGGKNYWAMNDTLMAPDSLTWGDYQHLTADFVASYTGIYWIAITGYISNAPYYLSLDDVYFYSNDPLTITLTAKAAAEGYAVSKTTAAAGEEITLTRPASVPQGMVSTPLFSCNEKIEWTGANTFRMPHTNVTVDAAVLPVRTNPYYESFEAGAAKGKAFNPQDYLVFTEESAQTYSRTGTTSAVVSYVRDYPQTYDSLRYDSVAVRGAAKAEDGKWMLSFASGCQWLMAPIQLNGGEKYYFGLHTYADKGGQFLDRSVELYIGNSPSIMDMTMLRGRNYFYDWDEVYDFYTPVDTAVYWVAIRVFAQSEEMKFYLDNFKWFSTQKHNITVDEEAAALGVTVTPSSTDYQNYFQAYAPGLPDNVRLTYSTTPECKPRPGSNGYFCMAPEDVVVHATATYAPTIEVASVAGGSPKASQTYCWPGNSVNIYPYTSSGYEFVRWEVNTIHGDSVYYGTNSYFNMPADSVIVRAVYKAHPAVLLDTTLVGLTLSTNCTIRQPGREVYVSASSTDANTYKTGPMIVLTLKGDTVKQSNGGNGWAYFNMPEDTVVVSAVVYTKQTIICDTTTGCSGMYAYANNGSRIQSAFKGDYVCLSGTDATGYDFVSWLVLTASGDTVATDYSFYMPNEPVICRRITKRHTYLVSFYDYKSELIETDSVLYQDPAVYHGATPTKPSTAQYDYVFSGWSSSLVESVASNQAYYACFTAITRKYLITFRNYDGTSLQADSVLYGNTPVFSGATPSKPATAQWKYSFKGWNPTVAKVSGEQVYVAQFDSTLCKHLVVFQNFNGDTLQADSVVYGAMPAYRGATPSREPSVEFTYTFSGWTPDLAAVNGEQTYTAQYVRSTRQYNIKFVDFDGTMLQQGKVDYGTVPTFNGTTPSRPSTAQYTFTFAGWSPALAIASADQVYTAQYDTVAVKYAITWKNYDGSVLAVDSIVYGTTPVCSVTPTRDRFEDKAYEFAGWTPALSVVVADAEYTAKYNEVTALYIVTFVDWDDTVLKVDSVEWKQAATAPQDPEREGYVFTGWSTTFSSVTDDFTVQAQYEIYSALTDEEAVSLKPRKVIEDGKVFILMPDGTKFDVTGRRVK